MAWRSTVLIGFTLLAGSALPAAAVEVRYRCDDGKDLAVTFDTPAGGGSGSARLVFAGTAVAVDLPQVLSADGGRYAKDGIEFWIKGSDGTLTRDGTTTTCRSN